MNEREIFISIAGAYLGVEAGDPAQLAILNIYNDQDKLPRGYKMKPGDAWCAAFVTSCGIMAGLEKTILPECGVWEMACLYRDRGELVFRDGRETNDGDLRTIFFSQYATAGDLIFYDWDGDGDPDHVGIIRRAIRDANDDTWYYTIEGNYQNAVRQRFIQADDPCVWATARPLYKDNARLVWVDCEELNLRSYPGMEAEILEKLAYREALEPDGEEDNGWLRVRYASIAHGVVTGWVGADWISQTEPPAQAKAKTAVNMREAPGATSFILRVIPSGTVLRCTGERETVGSSVWERYTSIETGDDGDPKYTGWINNRFMEAI